MPKTVTTLESFLDEAAIDSSINAETGRISIASKQIEFGDVPIHHVFWTYKGVETVSFKDAVQPGKDTIQEYFKKTLTSAAKGLYERGLVAMVEGQNLKIRREMFFADQAADMLNSLGNVVGVEDLTKQSSERQSGRTISLGILYAEGARKHLSEKDILTRIKAYYAARQVKNHIL